MVNDHNRSSMGRAERMARPRPERREAADITRRELPTMLDEFMHRARQRAPGPRGLRDEHNSEEDGQRQHANHQGR